MDVEQKPELSSSLLAFGEGTQWAAYSFALIIYSRQLSELKWESEQRQKENDYLWAQVKKSRQATVYPSPGCGRAEKPKGGNGVHNKFCLCVVDISEFGSTTFGMVSRGEMK